MTGGVTIGDLRREGLTLWICCCSCGRGVEKYATELTQLDDNQPVPTAGKRFRCSRCGSRTITCMGQLYDEPTFLRATRSQEKQRWELAHRRTGGER